MTNSSRSSAAVGSAPSGWSCKRVDQICHLGRGRVISEQEIRKHPGDYPVYSSQSRDEGVFGRLATFDFDGDYVTWTTDGAYAGTVFYRTGRFNCTNVCGTLKPRSDQDSAKFLASALAPLTPRHVSKLGNPKLMNNVMAAIEVLLPPCAEQSRIAAILDTVDAAIRETEAVVAKLRQVKAGLLHDLLTRGLDAHGHLRDPARHPEQFQDSPLGPIPIGWEVQTLEQITDPRAPICYGIVQVFESISNGVLVLAIRDILGDYTTGLHRTLPSIDANYARSRVRPGDVLISVKGTIGRIGLVPSHYVGNISRDLARIRPVKWVASRFLVHLLRSPGGQKTLELAQVGTTRAELSIAPLKLLKFAFPPTGEQQRIAEVLDKHEDLIGARESELSKLHSLKRGLAHDLLTGRVRVPL